MRKGDCLFLLSCGSIVSHDILERNTHNIVIHASKLPQGRGFAPLAWQILEGKNKIWISLFEAVEKLDSGDVYFQDFISFEGHELYDEMRKLEGEKVVAMALRFVNEYPSKGRPQHGKSTWYSKRRPCDSELNIKKTLRSQFNILRIVDNERYPAFFTYKGHTYILKISKKNN
ncbi:MAG: methionyl-tRNA formyltransferase [Patescibacteria group bacterium]|nr:methionyl-tRNA formyltransferase [Patescibacteria group bacterium]MDE2438448.1 methionyl-tRNA formyltransferase [Patescibacteria group bacterium]